MNALHYMLQFDYTNHRGDDHTYVIDEPVDVYRAAHGEEHSEAGGKLVITAMVIARDNERRGVVRTFIISKMRNITDVVSLERADA